MSNSLTVVLFFVYMWGFGFSIVSIFKVRINDFFEKHLMCLGIGLGCIPLIGIIMNFLGIPIKWWIFLLLSLAVPIYKLIKYYVIEKRRVIPEHPPTPPKRKGLFISMSTIFLIGVLVLYGVMNFVYIRGATTYSYLEDGDSYRHVAEAYQVAQRGSFKWIDRPFVLGVEEPYPQGYHILMGILFQTSSSINWTIKIINATIISLSLIFFYFFMKKWTNNEVIAFFSTFCLFAIPSFMTHFIWSTSLSLTLFFPAFYALELIKENKRWFFIGAVIISSILLTQITTSIAFGLFFIIYMIIKEVFERNNPGYVFMAGTLGVLLAAGFFYIPAYLHTGDRFLTQFGLSGNTVSPFSASEQSVVGVKYTLQDFISSPPFGQIDNSIGIGPFLSLLVVIGLFLILKDTKQLYKEKNVWNLISIVWLLIGFIGVNGGRLPISLFPHRFWAILAIPVCILAGVSFEYIRRYLFKTKFNPTVIIVIILILVLLTSGYSKYSINTAPWAWGSGIRNNPDEMEGFLHLSQLPSGTKVFPLCAPLYLPIAFDKSINWYDEEILYKSFITDDFVRRMNQQDFDKYNSTTKLIFEDPNDAHLWLVRNDFKYVLVEGNCAKVLKTDKIGEFFVKWVESGKFQVTYRTSATALFEVKPIV